MTALSELYDKTLKELRREKVSKLKEVAIGITAGVLYLLASGWLFFVTVMAR